VEMRGLFNSVPAISFGAVDFAASEFLFWAAHRGSLLTEGAVQPACAYVVFKR